MTENPSDHYFMKKLTLMLQAKLDEQLALGFKAYQYTFLYVPKEFHFNERPKTYKVAVYDPEFYKMELKEETIDD